MKAYYVEADWEPKSGYALSDWEKRTKRARRSNFVWKNIRAEVVDLDMPTPTEDQVLIKIGACGVCGSDISSLVMDEEGYTKFSTHLRLPVIMGHEFSGEVVEVGPKVIDLKVGDLVAVEQIHWCGKCRGCRIGKPNQCSYVEELGLSKNGGFAEYAVIEERFCCNINKLYEKLGDKLAAMEAGALVEPTCVAYSGMIINGGGFRPGANIAVFGAGPIGLAAISIAKVSGAAAIFAFDTMPARLVLAKEVGADYTMNPLELKKQGSSPCEQLLELTEGLGIGMFVEATGNTSAVYSDILHCMDISAKIIQLGVGAKNPEIDLTQLIIRNSSIQGSMGHAGNDIYPSVIRLMAAGKIDMRQIATARYSIEKTSDAINAAAYGTQGKVLVGQYYK